MTQTARIYGDSLYDLAAEEALTDVLLEQTEAVADLFRQNPAYCSLLSEPSVAKAERLSLLDQAFGGRVEVYLLNFLKILCENGLLAEYESCCQEYRRRYYEDRHIAVAQVTSAVALTKEQEDRLKTALEKKCGKQVLLKQKIKPSLIGGLRVELEGRLIDGTVAGRLAGMKRSLTRSASDPSQAGIKINM